MSIRVEDLMHGPEAIYGTKIKPEDSIEPVEIIRETVRNNIHLGRVYHGKWDKRSRPNASGLDLVPESVLVKEIDVTPENESAIKHLEREDRLLREVYNPAGIGPISYGRIETILPDGRRKLSLVMEDIPGMTLDSWFEIMYKKWTNERRQKFALKFGRDIASQLVKMQSGGIVHRDLKPENVIVDYDGNAQIIDFGTATTIQEYTQWDPEKDKDLKAIGTAEYVTPEQMSWRFPNITIDETTDVYTLALMMAEIMAGGREDAYEGTGNYDIQIENQKIHNYLYEGRVKGYIPVELYNILDAALLPSQAQRKQIYPNAAAFLTALNNVVL